MFKKNWVKLLLIPLVLLGSIIEFKAKRVYVKGYCREDGTYVRPYYRRPPDSNAYNLLQDITAILGTIIRILVK